MEKLSYQEQSRVEPEIRPTDQVDSSFCFFDQIKNEERIDQLKKTITMYPEIRMRLEQKEVSDQFWTEKVKEIKKKDLNVACPELNKYYN